MELLIMPFSPASCHIPQVQIFIQAFCSETTSMCSPNVRGQVSRPYKIGDTLSFWSLCSNYLCKCKHCICTSRMCVHSLILLCIKTVCWCGVFSDGDTGNIFLTDSVDRWKLHITHSKGWMFIFQKVMEFAASTVKFFYQFFLQIKRLVYLIILMSWKVINSVVVRGCVLNNILLNNCHLTGFIQALLSDTIHILLQRVSFHI